MKFLDIMLWVSLLIIVAGAVLPKKYAYKVAAVGWVLFGLRWGLSTPEFYLVEHNIMYTVACVLAIPVTWYLAYVMVKDERESLMVVTRAAAISIIFYFPFAYISWLGDWLIGVTTSITLAAVNALGYPATASGNIITLNGHKVEIILACTAIQSMALFVGIVGCIKAPLDRLFKAFMVSVPVIYILNIVRNTFVVSAYGNQWFQIAPDMIVQWTGELPSYASFFWAHNVLAETGSLIALVIISYVVISILPETLTYIRDIFSLIELHNIKKNLRGEKVAEVVPLQRKG
ncbi:MAG TPA: archaeosortase A [Methanocella sp.]|uniref:archaeosortase A n=1 Tax=Methanocella sp. TaxID=2052833 RepID=UPI002C54C85D|nr:archaeosortase A [Methanocella sp.]HTY90593.1 archaeosortase A [Methanocella sp.]